MTPKARANVCYYFVIAVLATCVLTVLIGYGGWDNTPVVLLWVLHRELYRFWRAHFPDQPLPTLQTLDRPQRKRCILPEMRRMESEGVGRSAHRPPSRVDRGECAAASMGLAAGTQGPDALTRDLR